MLRVSSKDAQSVLRLWELLSSVSPRSERPGDVVSRLTRQAHQQLDRWLRRVHTNRDPAWLALVERCREGSTSDEQAAAQMLALASGNAK